MAVGKVSKIDQKPSICRWFSDDYDSLRYTKEKTTGIKLITGLPVWQSQSESGWGICFFSFLFFFFFRVGKSLACHCPAKWYLCA